MSRPDAEEMSTSSAVATEMSASPMVDAETSSRSEAIETPVQTSNALAGPNVVASERSSEAATATSEAAPADADADADETPTATFFPSETSRAASTRMLSATELPTLVALAPPIHATTSPVTPIPTPTSLPTPLMMRSPIVTVPHFREATLAPITLAPVTAAPAPSAEPRARLASIAELASNRKLRTIGAVSVGLLLAFVIGAGVHLSGRSDSGATSAGNALVDTPSSAAASKTVHEPVTALEEASATRGLDAAAKPSVKTSTDEASAARVSERPRDPSRDHGSDARARRATTAPSRPAPTPVANKPVGAPPAAATPAAARPEPSAIARTAIEKTPEPSQQAKKAPPSASTTKEAPPSDAANVLKAAAAETTNTL